MCSLSWWRGVAGGRVTFCCGASAQDPVPQTVSAVHAAFDSLMDVLEAQQALAERVLSGRPHAAAAAAAAAMGGQSALAFQEAVAAELMTLGAQAITWKRIILGFFRVTPPRAARARWPSRRPSRQS